MHSFQKNFSRSPKRIQKPEITKEYPLEYSVEKMSEKPVIYSPFAHFFLIIIVPLVSFHLN